MALQADVTRQADWDRTIDTTLEQFHEIDILFNNAGRALKRMARPEEIAYGVLFLVADESSFVTGHALVIDGGQTIDT